MMRSRWMTFGLALSLVTATGSALAESSGDDPDATAVAAKTWIWISPEEVAQLPSSGAAWDQMLDDADEDLMSIDVADQNDKSDSYMMAAALVYRKLNASGDSSAESYRSRVQAACLAAIGTEDSADDSLAPARQVASVVIAGNLIDWSNPTAEAPFREWVDEVRFRVYPDGRSIVSTHETRPNNWGTHAGASRMACALYLNDATEAERSARVFAGWLGNRKVYSGFQWGDRSWQGDEDRPIGINASGTVKLGMDLGGVIADDQRRVGSFPDAWLDKTNYVYEALQGVVAQAVMIGRINSSVWNWNDTAILRAYRWLEDVQDQPITDSINGSDDSWQGFVVNRIYGTSFPTPSRTNPGKAVGYTDWTTLNPQWP